MNSMRGVHPKLQYYAEQLIALGNRYGLGARLTSGRRSHAEQKKLYEAYISGRSVLPAAPPGKSKHEFGLAVDITANSREALDYLGMTWRGWGGTWGGQVDPVHFEL